MGRMIVYSTGFCAYCFLAKRLLDRRGIEYVERKLTRRPSDRAELELLARGGRTFPQIFLDGEPIGGFAELRRLDRDGTLERMLSDRP